MYITHEVRMTEQVFFTILDDASREVARASILIGRNRLHNRPFCLLEDVFVVEGCRGQGLGNKVLNVAIAEARRRGCYKMIVEVESRFEQENVHIRYKRAGFYERGFCFRMDMDPIVEEGGGRKETVRKKEIEKMKKILGRREG